MNIAKKLLVLMLITFLTGCSFLTPTVRVKLDPACQWFEDQTLSEETKSWLPDAATWPEFVVADLSKIANNNDLYEQEC
jgi:hypothetical protein